MSTPKVDTPLARMQAVSKMVRAEKWRDQLIELTNRGVVKAEDTGGYGMQWVLRKPNDAVQAPVQISLFTGVLVQGGKRIKGFGVDGALDAINISSSAAAADNDPSAV